MGNLTTNRDGSKLTGAPTAVQIPPNYPIEPQPGKIEELLQYNERSIYHRFKPYTENSNLLKFGNEQPYVWRYIDEGDSSFESRAFPFRSGVDDIKRISKFLVSGRGVEFLGKQLLLQAQQKFDETGVYNPLEVPLATVRPISLGLIPRPQRHVNISGGVLGALTSLIGININNGNTAPPSSVGQEALPKFGGADGRGLLRAETANKAVGIIHLKYPAAGPQAPGRSGLSQFFKSAAEAAANTIKTFLKPIFPFRQSGVQYRGDEIMWALMRADGAGRFTSTNKDGEEIPLHSIRRENKRVLRNNAVYEVLDKTFTQYHRDDPYISEEYEPLTPLVDTSFPVSGIYYKSFRLARAGSGDGINQLEIISKPSSNYTDIPIPPVPGQGNWSSWNPYKDDLIAFFFYDIVNQKFIPFRATIKGITETTTANWGELRFIGRADQIFTYNGFVRSLAFQFTVVATSLSDLLPIWKRINYMKTSLKPAGYTVRGNPAFNRFIIPPMFAMTIGDLYTYQPIVINNFTVTIPENANWETLNEINSDKGWSYLNGDIKPYFNFNGKYAQLPKEADIALTCFMLEKERAQVGGVDFGHAPRNEDGELMVGESDKPYLPKPSEFSKNLLVEGLKISSPEKRMNSTTTPPITEQKVNPTPYLPGGNIIPTKVRAPSQYYRFPTP